VVLDAYVEEAALHSDSGSVVEPMSRPSVAKAVR